MFAAFMNNNKFLFTIYASLLATIGFFASDMYLPALNSMREEFDTTPGKIALSFSVYMFGFAVAQLFYGAISDQTGRKRPILVGSLVFIIGSIGCMFSVSIEMFLFFRVIQAVGIGSAYVLWQPIIIDLFDEVESQKMFSLIMVLSSLSPAIAPLLGGAITQQLGWQAVFAYLTLQCLLVFLLTKFGFSESLSNSRRRLFSFSDIIGSFRFFIVNRFFMAFSLTIACGLSLYLIFIALLPLFMFELGYAPANIGLMYIPLAVSFMLGAACGRRLFSKIGPQGVSRVGVVIASSGSGLLFLLSLLVPVDSAFLLVGVFCVVTFGNGFLVPTGSCYLVGKFSDKAGACASVMGFITSLLAVLSTSLASIMVDSIGIYAMTGTIMSFALVMLVAFHLARLDASSEVKA